MARKALPSPARNGPFARRGPAMAGSAVRLSGFFQRHVGIPMTMLGMRIATWSPSRRGESMSSTLQSTIRTAFAAGAVAVGSVACSTPTSLTSEWKNPGYTAGPLKNVLVVGARLDNPQRRTVEDTFVTALGSHGVHATPSYTLFPGPLPDGTTAQAAVQKEGFDGVLISTMRGVKERTYIEPGAGWGGGLYGDYWGPAWIGPAAVVQTDTYVKFETTVWSPTGGGQLIWSAVSQTENPTSGANFAQSLAKKIVPALAKDGLVPEGTGPKVSSVKLAP